MIFLFFLLLSFSSSTFYDPTNENIIVHGRVDRRDPKNFNFDWSAIEIYVQFTGNSIELFLSDTGDKDYYNVILDEKMYKVQLVSTQKSYVFNVSDTNPNLVHDFKLTKATESLMGKTTFSGINADSLVKPKEKSRKIAFYGDSLTCAYGVEGVYPCKFSPDTENSYDSYASVVARTFNAELEMVCWSGIGLIRNYGEEGPISKTPLPYYFRETCGRLGCGQYDFSTFTPELVVSYLGANDFYKTEGEPSRELYIDSYKQFINNFTSVYPEKTKYVLVCGDTSVEKTKKWCGYVKEVVDFFSSDLDIAIVQFDPSNIKIPDDMGCDYHPNTKGQTKRANEAIPIIKEITGWN